MFVVADTTLFFFDIGREPCVVLRVKFLAIAPQRPQSLHKPP